MRSPSGWAEPGQRPEFDEFTIVLRGALAMDSEEGQMTVQAGQGVHARPGELVRYRPSTIPARPSDTSATSRWKPSRSAADEPGWPWSMSITVTWLASQPSATALPRRSCWRIADSVLWMTCLRLDWRGRARPAVKGGPRSPSPPRCREHRGPASVWAAGYGSGQFRGFWSGARGGGPALARPSGGARARRRRPGSGPAAAPGAARERRPAAPRPR
jgi:hypothetical protein